MELNPCYFSSKRSWAFVDFFDTCFRASPAEVNFVVVNLSRRAYKQLWTVLCITFLVRTWNSVDLGLVGRLNSKTTLVCKAINSFLKTLSAW